jgi:hypothetical protein
MRQAQGAIAIMLQEMQRHSLGSLGTYSGEAAESAGQLVKAGERLLGQQSLGTEATLERHFRAIRKEA